LSEAEITIPCSWAKKSQSSNAMTVLDCWLGIQVAYEHKWIDASSLLDEARVELACNKFLSMAISYDASWLVPGSVIVCSDPTTVIVDPNPATCTELWPLSPSNVALTQVTTMIRQVSEMSRQISGMSDQNSRPSPLQHVLARIPSGSAFADEHVDADELEDLQALRGTSKQSSGISRKAPVHNMEVQLPTVLVSPPVSPSMSAVSPKNAASSPAKSMADSTATVCKDYDVTADRMTGEASNSLQPFFEFLRKSSVRTVVRANYRREPGMVMSSYDASRLDGHGLHHLDLPYDDTKGAVPPVELIAKLLQTLERSNVSMSGTEAICFHCKGGFGRSMVLACCFVIHELDVSGRAMLAWARIARPGAITTPEQEQLLCSIKGRESLRKIIESKCCCALQ